MARLLFELSGIRRRNGQLATGVAYIVSSDEAGTSPADISATSGASATSTATVVADTSVVTTADIAGLGPAALRFYGPDDVDTLWLQASSDTLLGVQKLEAATDPRLDTLEAGGGGSHPNLAVHDTLGLATDAELGMHAADTTSVHGIADTTVLATTSGVASSIITHAAATDPHADRAYARAYADSVAQGLDVKLSVRVASTADLTLSGEQTIDGVLTSADRVLVKNQTAGAANGIYVSAAGAWSRAVDADISAELSPGSFTFVEEGTVNGGTGWVQATPDPVVLDTTALVFTQFSGGGTVIGGAGLLKTGNTLDVGAGTGITVAADTVGIASGGVTNTQVSASAGIAESKLALNFPTHAIDHAARHGAAGADPLTGYVPATVFDAKGDLLAATAADTAVRLAVGTNGYGLTSDTTATTGLRWVAPPVFNVKAPPFNAAGNNATDDTAAIQAAIDAAVAAGRGEVYLPAGIYLYKPQVARSTDPGTVSNQGHALAVTGSDITIRGAGREATQLIMRPYASISGNHETSYQTVSGKVWRGGGIFITGGTVGTPRKNVLIRDLTLEGGCAYTGDTTNPANAGTGDGWDITHKGVWLENDKYFDDIRVEDCRIAGFKGEIIYYGGTGATLVTAERCELHETNGDCWSVSGQAQVRDNEMYRAAHAAIEDSYVDLPGVYERNYIHDCANHGISIYPDTGRAEMLGPILIHDNLIKNCPQNGIIVQRGRNLDVRRNTVIDCGRTNGFRGIVSETAAGLPARNVKIVDNRVVAHLQDVHTGILVADTGAAGYQGLEIRDNTAELTEYGRSLGKTLTTPFGISAVPGPSDVISGNRALRSTNNATDQAACFGRLLPTTSATDVVTLTPWCRGQYRVSVSYRVITGATNVTVTLAWTDDGGAQTKTLLALTSKAVGTYVDLPPVIVDALTTAPIKVTVSAGTADQVYVSASIDEVASAGPVFSPANLAALALWLKADAITATTDGTALASWPDSSDFARHATQATGANRPLYKANIVNGKPVVRFDGTNDWLVSTLTAPAAVTLTIVGRRLAGGGAQRICGWNGQASIYDSGAWQYYSNEADGSQGFAGDSDDWTVLTVKWTSTSAAQLYRNGTAEGSSFDPKDSYSGATSLGIGAEAGAGGNVWNGDVAEVLVYFSALSDPNRLLVERYLGRKYGLTVA